MIFPGAVPPANKINPGGVKRTITMTVKLLPKLILASQSPRRFEILRAAGWAFDAVAANIDETRLANEDAVSYVRRLAQTKAETIAEQFPHS